MIAGAAVVGCTVAGVDCFGARAGAWPYTSARPASLASGDASSTLAASRQLAIVIASRVPEYLFELYVAGGGIRSRTAVETLTAMCDERLAGRYGLEVIDVLVDPERAEHAKILATPTLLRRKPAPDVRVIGDLTLTRSVLAKLGVPAGGAHPVGEVRRDA